VSEKSNLERLIALRAEAKRLSVDPGTPEMLRFTLAELQLRIKFAVNSSNPRGTLPPMKLVEQVALMKQHEEVTRTAQTALRRILAQLEELDFRPVMSANDYAMSTILANVNNAGLTDAEFRDFMRTFLEDDPDAPTAEEIGRMMDSINAVNPTPPPVEDNALYCDVCGGVAEPHGYNQWVCADCHAPLGPARVSSVSKKHQSL
jgi:hypothetical protein